MGVALTPKKYWDRVVSRLRAVAFREFFLRLIGSGRGTWRCLLGRGCRFFFARLRLRRAGCGLGGSLGRFLRNFDVGHVQIRKRVAEDRTFVVRQVAARLFLDHLELIDEHLRQLEIDFTLTGLGIWDLPQKKGGVLRMHHDKLDEALRKLTTHRAGLSFSRHL